MFGCYSAIDPAFPKQALSPRYSLLNILDTEYKQTKQVDRSMETGRNDNFVEGKSKIVTESGYMPYMEMKVT